MSDEKTAATVARLRELYTTTVELFRREDHPMFDLPSFHISPNETRVLLDRLETLETAFAAARPSLETEALEVLESLVDNVRFLDVEFFDAEEQAEAEKILANAQALLEKAGRR